MKFLSSLIQMLEQKTGHLRKVLAVAGNRQQLEQHALIDSSTRALLVLHPNSAVIKFLSGCMPNTFFITYVDYPNYPGGFNAQTKSGALVHWMWDMKTRTFRRTSHGVSNDELVLQSSLAIVKSQVLNEIMRSLSHARIMLRTGIELQDSVYTKKKIQAERFKDSGYDEGRILEYPFILHYADFAGLSLKVAADEILLKARFYDDALAKTELLRLTYYDKLKKAQEIQEIEPILAAFRREAYINAQI